MSRSDSPQAPPGGWPAQRPHGDYDPNAWTQGLAGAPRPNPQPQAQPPQGYTQRPAAQPPVAGAYGHQGQGYYWGNEPATALPQTSRAAAPQLDPYLPAASPSRPAAQAPAQNYGQPPAGYTPPPASYAPAPQAAAYGQERQPELRGSQYDQWAAAGQPSDPRGYDLSSYMPPQSRTGPPATQDYAHAPADYGTAPAAGYADWGHQAGGYGQPAAQSYASQGFDNQFAEAGAQPQGEYDEEHGYEYEEPPRRSKMMMVAAALVGAVVVGGGLTYAYQSLLGSEPDGPTPVVKSALGPIKEKPANAGGKQFAHSDSKLLGRLGDNSGSSTETDAAGSRKVSTLVVGRDGTIQPPAEAPKAADVSVPVPGLTLVDVPAPGASAPAPKPPQQANAAAPVVVTPPAAEKPAAKPIEVADARSVPTSTQAIALKTLNAAAPAAEPVVPAAPDAVKAPAAPAAPAPVAEKPKPAPPVKTAAVDPAPAPARVAAPAPTGAGYVAVLASVPASGSSRINALQQFADLQQKYGSILQNKTPDVQEANLGEKGTYHRLIVGPPGSRDGASSVCSQLKTAGYAGCWVMAY